MRAYLMMELSLLAQDVPSQKKMLRIFKVTFRRASTNMNLKMMEFAN
jgi:hypothetical protein